MTNLTSSSGPHAQHQPLNHSDSTINDSQLISQTEDIVDLDDEEADPAPKLDNQVSNGASEQVPAQPAGE